jgi:hypothetical protein
MENLRQSRSAPNDIAMPTPRANTRGQQGFVMMVVLTAALCAFLLLAMVADMQILSHVQNRKFKQDIQQRITDLNIRIVPKADSAKPRPQ